MTAAVANPREISCGQSRTLTGINMGLIDHYVEQYLANPNDKWRSPAEMEVAKAAIALKEAWSKRGRQSYDPNKTEGHYSTDAEAHQKAINAFGGGYLPRGVSWGIKHSQIPHHASFGEYVTIEYVCLNRKAIASGFVTDVYNFPRGKGLVIRLTETNNGFNIQPGGWRYVSLWIPANGGMAGFL